MKFIFEAKMRCKGDCDYCPCLFLDRQEKWRCGITEERVTTFSVVNENCPLKELKDDSE